MSSFKLLKTVYELTNIIVNEPLILFLKDNQHTTMNKDLNRFLEAQENDYKVALAEIKSGKKRSHWMWYIFPQFKGLVIVIPPNSTLSVIQMKQRNFLITQYQGQGLRKSLLNFCNWSKTMLSK